MLYPRTISDQRTESQHKSRNTLFDEAQSKDQLHGGGSCTNAVKDESASRARLVDGRYQCFISKKTGRVLKATENQMISSQEWRIPCEKISIKTIKERTEEYV